MITDIIVTIRCSEASTTATVSRTEVAYASTRAVRILFRAYMIIIEKARVIYDYHRKGKSHTGL
jgi:hypothetical protein